MTRNKRSDIGNSTLLPKLKERNQWMGWYIQADEEDGKSRKKPFPHSQFCSEYKPGIARFKDEDNWLSYYEAQQLYEDSDSVDGIGFVLSKSDDFIVLDIDYCIDPTTNRIVDEVAQLLNQTGTYAEVSPSGKGLHVILKGSIPRQGWTDEPEEYMIEIYDRFFITVTHNHILGTHTVAISNQSFLDSLFKKYDITWPDPKFTSFWPEQN